MSAPQNSSRKKVTPRALVRKQVENKDFHVSEEDMTNLDTSIDSAEDKFNEFSNEHDNHVNERKGTPYDILGE